MELPRNVAERVARVQEYHRSTKYTFESVRSGPFSLDHANRPSPYRLFEACPKVPLSNRLLDVGVDTLAVLEQGLDAVPESQVRPPQDLKTLSTWLHLANGRTRKLETSQGTSWRRTCPSAGDAFPCEIYVAAFGVAGLEPGFYHYSVREFSLRRLRGAHETLALIKRGRPDLEFLKTVPLLMLVSAVHCRSAWRFKQRAYRISTVETGQLFANLMTVATSLGITTVTRLQISESATRELIGLPSDPDFADDEAVHGMIAWGDQAETPLPPAPPAPANGPAQPMPPLAREPLAVNHTVCPDLRTAHHDCVAPGVTVREVRPPLTEASPLPPDHPFTSLPPATDQPPGESVGHVLLHHEPSSGFQHRPIPRTHFMVMNRFAFRGGSAFPMFPDGPHLGLVRPYWIVNAVTGMESGLWYYHPPADRWSLLREGDLRERSEYLSLEQTCCGAASAACFVAANLGMLMNSAGPDTYRLAHLEAGIAAQRVRLSANAMGFDCHDICQFYDDEVKDFCGLAQTGWEAIAGFAIGVAQTAGQPVGFVESEEDDSGVWHD